ncbi:MAG: hypothetical protein AAF609_08845 [Cyanobacteria bacterium P01_C01_bin.120]
MQSIVEGCSDHTRGVKQAIITVVLSGSIRPPRLLEAEAPEA